MKPPDGLNRWHAFAHDDLRMAKLALDEGLFNQVCFHAQQATEKILKGMIAAGAQVPPKTHKIADLLQLVASADIEVLKQELILLDRHYIPTRYPEQLPGMLPEGMPNEKDACQALQTAERLWSKVDLTQS